MKKIITILIIGIVLATIGYFIFIALSSLGPGSRDFSYKVAGNYMLYRNSADQIFVAPQGGYSLDDPQIIPAKVVEIAWDKKFVIAKQQGFKPRSPNNSNDTYQIPDETVFNYWILDTNIPKAYGPLGENEFEKMKESLSVPQSLMLKDVNSYK